MGLAPTMSVVRSVCLARARARRALVCQAGEAAVVLLPDLRDGEGRGDARFRIALGVHGSSRDALSQNGLSQNCYGRERERERERERYNTYVNKHQGASARGPPLESAERCPSYYTAFGLTTQHSEAFFSYLSGGYC